MTTFVEDAADAARLREQLEDLGVGREHLVVGDVKEYGGVQRRAVLAAVS